MNIYPEGGQLLTQWVAAHRVGNYPRDKVKMGAGVGRTAMSEEHDANESDEMNGSNNPINRRRFVKGLGAAGVASIGMSSTVSASVNDDTFHIGGGTIEIVSGYKSNKAAANARSAESFRKLRKYLQNEYGYQVDVSEKTVAEVENPNGKTHSVVSFDVVNRGSGPAIPDWQVSVAVVLQNGQALRAKGVIIRETNSELMLEPQNSQQDEELTEIKVVGGNIHKETKKLPKVGSTEEDSGVTVQSTPASCGQCIALLKAVGYIGCGWGVAFICSAVGLATIGIGGAVCAAIIYGVCSLGMPIDRDARASCQAIGDC